MRSAEPARALLLILALALLPAGAASAHSRSVSYSNWTLEGSELRMQLRLPPVELNRAGFDPRDPQLPAQLAARLEGEFHIASAGGDCVLLQANGRRGGDGMLLDAHWHCPQRPQSLRSTFLRDRVPGHLHLLQLHEGGRLSGPWALGPGQPQIALPAVAAAVAPQFGRYMGLGAGHILGGWDHLAYLLVVLLGATGLATLAWRITGFTLGHSLTLLLASRGWVQPQPAMVEAFIALTIVCAAAGLVLQGHRQASRHAALIALALGLLGWLAGVLPATLALAAVLMSTGTAAGDNGRLEAFRTAVFGLFHGLGFAAVLGALDRAQALPVLPLLGFNLGVELGQLLFVIPAWLLLSRLPRATQRGLASLVLALGTFWFLDRLH